MVPFKGTFAGLLLDFGPVVPGRCDETPAGKIAWAVTSFAGSGNATHMGNTQAYADHCSYGVVDADGMFMPDGTYGQGELTLTAANGDVLFATYTNGVSFTGPPVIEFADYFTFEDGGTGRFTFATGGGVEAGSVDVRTNEFTLRMEGVIAYSKR
jgi:hypothetical protein